MGAKACASGSSVIFCPLTAPSWTTATFRAAPPPATRCCYSHDGRRIHEQRADVGRATPDPGGGSAADAAGRHGRLHGSARGSWCLSQPGHHLTHRALLLTPCHRVRRVWDRHALVWHRPQLPRCEDDPARPPPRNLWHGHGTRRSLPTVWRGHASMVEMPWLAAARVATHRTRSPPACSGLASEPERSASLLGCRSEAALWLAL